ncbi:hypothetical protein CEP52_015361 [Fusarium oligoseptatum]|uniref:TPR-like protein n=1 Tax=Fusarium oligoseptatum TaxID=2604345 RepID=A0A428SDY1_9HYPO|nr:hypothetical protein CEP52_015361 [Fusarium oligoseptatum]
MSNPSVLSAASNDHVASPEVAALLEQWDKAVKESMNKLQPRERDEIMRFHESTDLEADLQQKLRLSAQGKLKKILPQISPFFGALEQLRLLFTASMPAKSWPLTIVSGGAYLVVKQFAEYDEASNKIIVVLEKFRKQLVLFKSFSAHLDEKLCREGLVEMFIALINFWAESVGVLRRIGEGARPDRLDRLDQQVGAAMQKMEDSITFLKQLQESRVGLSDNVAKAQTKVLEQSTLKDAAEGAENNRNFLVLREWLENTSKRWLMIYDNVNDFRLLDEFCPPETGSMIVTSRFYSVSYAFLDDDATRISLQKFGLDDSLHLFNRYRKLRDPDNDTTADLNETKELLESIDGLALGIKQMAFYIVSKGLSVSEFLDEYNGMAKYVLNRQAPDDRHSLGTLWNMQFEDIKQTNAAKLLGILSMAGPDGFPRELLKLDDPPDEEVAGWVEFCADREDPVGLLEPSSLQEAFDGLLFLLSKRFPHATASEGLWKHWAVCSRYVTHVAALAHAFKNSQERPRPIRPSTAFVKLMTDATWYLFEIGELNESKALLDIADEACPNKQSLQYAYICNVYVAIAVDKNDMEMGRTYSEKAIAIREAQLSPTDANLALSYNNFANTLNNEGKFSEALAHYTMANNILSDVEGTEMTVYGALAQLNMARSFAFKGEADKAIALFKSSGEFFYKKSHNMFLIGVEYTWASFLLKCNDPLAALGKLKVACDMAKDLIPFSMTLSGIYYKLGVTQLEMGLPMEAKDNFGHSLQLAELHRREGEIARSARQLAALIRSDPQSGEAEKKEAEELSERAEKIKNAHWKAIEKFVPRDEDMEEEEKYNWLVAAWYR